MKEFKSDIKSQRLRIKKVIDVLKKIYPEVKIQLEFANPFELLVATILSAQCTDDRVNKVTGVIFKTHNKPEDFANLSTDKLEKMIFSTGYYKAKARHIKLASQMIIDEYSGKVPDTMEELLKIPGVGRKTANVILGHCFGIPGIVVDTHVIRISNLLGFVNSANAEKIEQHLMKIIPKSQWVVFTHYFINHGRKTCIARRPKCRECPISMFCPSAKY